jgi:hypothetical protein
MEGFKGTNANRIPFAYRAKISGLLANATYRYMNQIVNSADAASTSGSGNCIFVPAVGDFVRTSSPSLSTAGGYGAFTTDASGAYEGWFVNEPTGNNRFVPGKFVFVRIMLNDGGSGTAVALRLTSADSVRVVKLDPAASDSTGTGLRGSGAGVAPRDFVFAYDNTAGTGRPVSGSYIESDGTDNSTANNYAAFYANNVNGTGGAFGMVLPNALPNGIRRIERRSLATGSVVAAATDADGIWPSGANTAGPTGGTTEIVLTTDDLSSLTRVEGVEILPARFVLEQNHPNPFNPSTTIRFSLPGESRVTLDVYNLAGERVATLVNGRCQAGAHSVSFDASRLPCGMYVYRLSAEGFTGTGKAMLLK